jgi:3-deoxy-7-phosphoheptulonate synthase
MVVIMKPGATKAEVGYVVHKLGEYGLRAHVSAGEERTVVGMLGDERKADMDALAALPGVERVVPVAKPYKLASREGHPQDRPVKVNGVTIGGGELVVMAGPCSVEKYDVMLAIARAAREDGATVLRGGAYKPRTSPYEFEGQGKEGLEILQKVGREVGMPVITEVLDTRDVGMVSEYADILQIGARNAQNQSLLDEVGHAKRPVLLKRGMCETINEWLLAAERIMKHGNENVMLCERGIRTFETYTRNTLDTNAITAAKLESYLPVIGDPSHATGKRGMVYNAAMACIAAGADGLLVEAHVAPDKALSDGQQTIAAGSAGNGLGKLVSDAREIHALMHRLNGKSH